MRRAGPSRLAVIARKQQLGSECTRYCQEVKQMLHRVFSSLSMRFGAAVLLAGLLVLGVIAPVQPVSAQQIHRFVGHPIQVPANHSLRQSLINTGSHPLVVRFLFLKAADFSPIASSSPMMVDAQSGVFFEWSTFPNDAFVLPALEIQG